MNEKGNKYAIVRISRIVDKAMPSDFQQFVGRFSHSNFIATSNQKRVMKYPANARKGGAIPFTKHRVIYRLMQYATISLTSGSIFSFNAYGLTETEFTLFPRKHGLVLYI